MTTTRVALALGFAAMHRCGVATFIWREHVAAEFIEAGRALATGNTRQASTALGTALAYLEKARASGDSSATVLLLQLSRSVEEESTERFSFAPGELEQLKAGQKPG